MGKLLDLVITHYLSPWEVGKPWFDSLAMQRGINFDDIGVILVNDGEESRLDDELFKPYPFAVQNLTIEHGGIPISRNAGLDAADAEWVMVCDFDDCFLTVNALSFLLEAGKDESKVMFESDFLVEEPKKDGGMGYGMVEKGSILNHGKMYRLSWLREEGIRFHPKLPLHEDVYFNTLIRDVAGKDRIGTISFPFYLWCFNKDSVSRNIPDWELTTYRHKIRQRSAITEEYRKRRMLGNILLTVGKTIVEAFYEFQRTDWRGEERKEAYGIAEQWFSAFLREYWDDYMKLDPRMTAALMKETRNRMVDSGTFLAECMTFRDFIIHMMGDVEPVQMDL